LDTAWSRKDGALVMLALDWAKAFDSVAPEALLTALRRFGVPECFVRVVDGIYSARQFSVRDAGSTSAKHPQLFGICQGCPLSPFLFAIVMTMLMHDAKHDLAQRGSGVPDDLFATELLYADDTLIVDVDSSRAELFMNCIGRAGSHYGLSFNWRKLEVLPVRCEAKICKPDGAYVPEKSSLVYLGSLLSSDGLAGSELNRRLGAASSEFKTLSRIWSHAKLSVEKKLRIFDACVLSKLLYCLHTTWLNVAERSKLDAFHVRCLRKIVGVAHSYVSRISNQIVLERAGRGKLSAVLLQRQLELMANIARKSDDDVLRSILFENSTCHLKQLAGKRRRGRPRAVWASEVFKHALLVAGSHEALDAYWQNTVVAHSIWQAAVQQYCSSL
jgi:hypothetical protein